MLPVTMSHTLLSSQLQNLQWIINLTNPFFFGNDRSFESASFLGSVFLLLLLFDIHVRIENAT